MKPSLIVTRGEGNALVQCFAGCRIRAIVAALGLTMADLFDRDRQPDVPVRVVATYDYRDLQGTLLARKARRVPKGFHWQQYSPAVGPYRLPDLIDTRTVYLTEGEKSCDRLWTMGIAATCGPNGASRWMPAWSWSLWMVGCRDLIVLPDNDRAGCDHAERVAAITHALAVEEPIVVKVVPLPGLPYSGDVVDWLDAGHDGEDLAALVAATPTWSPEQRADERQRHRQALRQQRNRRYRARLRASRDASRDIRTVSARVLTYAASQVRR